MLQGASMRHAWNQSSLAGWHAEKRHNLHLKLGEMLKGPNKPFHPFWYDILHEDQHARRNVERDLLGDVMDAVSSSTHCPPGSFADIFWRVIACCLRHLCQRDHHRTHTQWTHPLKIIHQCIEYVCHSICNTPCSAHAGSSSC